MGKERWDREGDGVEAEGAEGFWVVVMRWWVEWVRGATKVKEVKP